MPSSSLASLSRSSVQFSVFTATSMHVQIGRFLSYHRPRCLKEWLASWTPRRTRSSLQDAPALEDDRSSFVYQLHSVCLPLIDDGGRQPLSFLNARLQ